MTTIIEFTFCGDNICRPSKPRPKFSVEYVVTDHGETTTTLGALATTDVRHNPAVHIKRSRVKQKVSALWKFNHEHRQSNLITVILIGSVLDFRARSVQISDQTQPDL